MPENEFRRAMFVVVCIVYGVLPIMYECMYKKGITKEKTNLKFSNYVFSFGYYLKKTVAFQVSLYKPV